VTPWRMKPGLIASAALHAALLAFALLYAGNTKKFEDALETVAVDVVTDKQLAQAMKGEKAAKEIRAAPRVDKIAETPEPRPKPPIAEAKRDIPAPPPSLKRLPDPGEDEQPPTPTPPKRIAAAPQPPAREKEPTPTPQARPTPTPPIAKPPVAKRPAAAPPEKDEPEEAEVVKPKPPTRPKAEKAEAADKPTPKPPEKPAEKAAAKPDPKPRLKTDEVAKLLKEKSAADGAKGETADAPQKGAKPKSGDQDAPKSKFNSDEVAKLLSHEAPQRKASTGADKTQVASIGAPDASAPKLSANMSARIGRYIQDHYQQCWHDTLSMGQSSYTPIVSFKLTRAGALEGRPQLENPAGDPVGKARGDQALQAIRECSPMPIPAEFAPYYEEALHEVEIRMRDTN
jgi:hypothetical protein